MNREFYHQTVTTQQVENYISKESGLNLENFFNQYLRNVSIPTLEYYFSDEETLHYRWGNSIISFDMPVDLAIGIETMRISPTSHWQQTKVKKSGTLTIDSDYYVGSFRLR